MKVVHINSREELDLSYPNHYKYYSVYGLLVMSISGDIFFIDDAEQNSYVCITDEFEILN